MQRLHVNLQVADLNASRRFYTQLFAAEPTVAKDDYAKWMLDEPRVNFSIVFRGGEPGFGHLGIQAETPEELSELRRRVGRIEEERSAAGEKLGEVIHEGQTVCCYHRSDKTWVTDGQGIAWEAFHTAGETATFDDGYEKPPGAAACPVCADGTEGADGKDASACCSESAKAECCGDEPPETCCSDRVAAAADTGVRAAAAAPCCA